MRRFLAVLMVLSLVSVAFVPAPATAATWGVDTGDCDEVDEFLWVVSIGLFNEHCDSSALSEDLAELEQDMQNSTELQIYNTGKQVQSDTEQFLTVMNNSMGDSGTVAMSKAEAAAIAEIDAGGSLSSTKTAAAEAVEDYYTVKQLNLIDQYGTTVSTVATMENTSEAAGLSEQLVRPEPTDNGDFVYYVHTDTDTETLTLINGSQVLSRRLIINDTTYGEVFYYGVSTPPSNNAASNIPTRIDVGPITDHSSYDVIVFADYRSSWSEMTSKSTQMKANAREYAAALYNDTSGDVNASTYVSPSTLAQEYSTDYNSTGYYSYAVGWAATAGFAIPNMNETSLMTISTGTGTYEGLLMSQNPPNGSGSLWEVGKTYDASLIEGKQFVARTNGNVTEITGTFTITSMEDENGVAVQNTSIQHFEYKTANTSAEYAALQEQIRALQTEIAEDEDGGLSGPGGAGSGGLGNMGLIGLVVAVVVGAGALMSNSGSGRRRRR